MRWLMLRVGVALALATSSGAAALPVAAHPTVEVANPRPDDRLIPGAVVMQGVAFDHDARDGTGVDHVSIFMGSRDHGGQYLGEATLSMPSTMPALSAQFASAGWILKTPALKGEGDQRTLYVYVHSSVTDTEMTVKIPVTIGQQPPPAGHTERDVEPVVPAGAGTIEPVAPAGAGPSAPGPAPGASGGTAAGMAGEQGGPEE
jgi:hypothetical protein